MNAKIVISLVPWWGKGKKSSPGETQFLSYVKLHVTSREKEINIKESVTLKMKM